MNTTRRELLKILGLSSAGLVVGCTLPTPVTHAEDGNGWQVDAFLHLSPEGVLTFVFPRAEMGQGIMHGLTTLIAEELTLAPERIVVLQAPADEAYGNPLFPGSLQGTGGSTSMLAHFEGLRQAAANMRAALLSAAGPVLSTTADALTLDEGYVVAGNDHHPWGQYAVAAASQPLPDAAPLKPAADFKYIGRDIERIDATEKSVGTATFGIDIDFEGLKRAVVVRCPVIGGKPLTHNGGDIATQPGVRAVVDIYDGVAVVADKLWQAKTAAAKLEVEWEYPETLRAVDSATLRLDMGLAADENEGKSALDEGDVAAAMAAADAIVEGEYWAPFLAHATMEPMNCTVKLGDDRCDVWTGNQAPGLIQKTVMTLVDLEADQVFIHNQYLGGGFGRRTTTDMVQEAVEIARATGMPIQVVWSREDDMRNDYYRPASLMRYRGAIAGSKLSALTVQRTGPNIMPYFLAEVMDDMTIDMLPAGIGRFLGSTGAWLLNAATVDDSSVEGLAEDYHDIPNKQVNHVRYDPGLRLGFWRSVGHSFSAFGKESFMDEAAVAAGVDPIAFRVAQLGDNPRMKAALEKVAEISNWNSRRANGEAIGVACHTSFNTAVAEVARVEILGDEIHVREVWCAVDCGLAVNPNVVHDQMQSGIIFGLSAALWGEITLKDGVVEQGNFNDYRVVRMDEAPRIEVAIVNATGAEAPLGGVGEPGTPPIAPAVANAVYAATSTRLRELPLRFPRA
ncbi:MAG: molybdopterin cofactor-binding domain-containing protein [Halieaceae bacterium]|jgi:CO/xanthine dehydrogenase Mo-binding subunit|nr:molybdopterin cofactor-binding domain-containing protein [Halieaceae bacterium]